MRIQVDEEHARWVIATGNPGKESEIREILAESPVELCSLTAFNPISFPEEGLEYEANAIAKARVVAEFGLPVCDPIREGAEPLAEAVLRLRDELELKS